MFHYKSIVVTDTPSLTACLRQRLPDTQFLRLDEFIPNGKPVVFVLQSQNLPVAESVFRSIDEPAKAQSIITGRVAKGESVPQDLPRHTVLIPWCDDESYLAWLQFLAGIPGIVPSPDWLFVQNWDVHERDDIRRLKVVIDELRIKDICELTAHMLAQKYPCSRSSLAHYCRLLYGVPAGTLCRVWRVFTQTSVFLHEEQKLLPNGRYGQSPIRCLDGDYLNSLARVIGMRYTDLRLAAQREHWVVVLLRGWRGKPISARVEIG